MNGTLCGTTSGTQKATNGYQQVRRRGEGSGAVRQLPSKRWQARYPSPDGEVVTTKEGKIRTKVLSGKETFDTKLDAEGWLDRKGWLDDPKHAVQHVDPRLHDYANEWLAGREIKPRTRAHYRHLLDTVVLPALGDRRLTTVTPPIVRAWHASMAKDGHPTLRAHSYGLLRIIMDGYGGRDHHDQPVQNSGRWNCPPA